MSDAVREAAASPSPPAAPYPGSSPPPMAPQELHRYLVRIHRQRNRLDWRFFQGLLALDEGQIYGPLGYPSSQSYAQQHFGMGRTALFEALRVAGTRGRFDRSASP